MMLRPPPTSTLFPYTTLFRSAYTLRLHFFEPYSLSPGQRVFDIKLQGATALAGYDIAGDAGDGAKATQQTLTRSEEHTSELQSHVNLVCRLLLEKKKKRSRRP